jgi:hypothetical protein
MVADGAICTTAGCYSAAFDDLLLADFLQVDHTINTSFGLKMSKRIIDYLGTSTFLSLRWRGSFWGLSSPVATMPVAASA